MNLLYLGRYKARFNAVLQSIRSYPPGVRVLELCFGDIYVAQFCRRAGYVWTGLDINKDFVSIARKMSFDAQEADLTKLEQLPAADICVMMGSFYHFHFRAENLLLKMFQASPTVILSEPVSNLSTKKGLIGWLAKRAANAGKGHELFRYDNDSFFRTLEDSSQSLGFTIEILQAKGRDMVVKLVKKDGNR